MSDAKEALFTLCKYVNLLTNVDLTVEHLMLAKRDTSDRSAVEALWNALHILSYHAAREKRSDIDFRDYDISSAVKLHLAFLQYPTIDFYNLSRSSNRSRYALIALAWLLATQDVLTVLLRTRLINGILGTECSHVDPPEFTSLDVPNDEPSSTNARLDNILHLNAKVNLNLREISELCRERSGLTSKIHAASIDACGLPHLNACELALTKRHATAKALGDAGDCTEADRRRLREFHDAGVLLEVRAKWLRKRHVFFDWTATVIQEHKRSMESLNPEAIDWRELVAFSSLLHHVIKRKLKALVSAETVGDGSRNSALNCSSRAYRSRLDNIEAQIWLDDLNESQNRIEENLQRNRRHLADELRKMLKLIPFTVHV